MEKRLLNSPQSPDENQDSVIAEMVLDHALLAYRREKLYQEIDRTLKEGNKEKFLELTEKLKEIS